MHGLYFITGLILGFGWGLVVARELVLELMKIEAAIEATAESVFC
jgi:hypothetical protein